MLDENGTIPIDVQSIDDTPTNVFWNMLWKQFAVVPRTIMVTTVSAPTRSICNEIETDSDALH